MPPVMILPLALHLVFVLFIQVGLSHAATFQAKVIHVTDGDTITVLNDSNRQIKIRLNGIDCPEKAQAYGDKATQFTKDLVHREMVTIDSYNKDRDGRTIGEVILDDGRSLNRELVKAGYAWWYRKYAPGNMILERLETEAREAKAGLWNDPHPIPPWDFRHRRGRTFPEPESPPTPPPTVESPTDSFDSSPVVANLRSGKYHRIDCPSFNAVVPHNRLIFPSVQAAEKAGFEVAGNCPP